MACFTLNDLDDIVEDESSCDTIGNAIAKGINLMYGALGTTKLLDSGEKLDEFWETRASSTPT